MENLGSSSDNLRAAAREMKFTPNPKFDKIVEAHGLNKSQLPLAREIFYALILDQFQNLDALIDRVSKDFEKKENTYVSLFHLSFGKWAKKFAEKGPEMMNFEHFYEEAKTEGEQGLKTFWTQMVALLGHEWEVKTKVKVDQKSDKALSTEGYYHVYTQGYLAHSVEKFFEQMPDKDLPSNKEEILEALKLGPLYGTHQHKAGEIVERIKDGKTTVMATGWEGHATYLVFMDKYVAYVNLGDRLDDMESGITIYNFNNKELLTENHIHKIQTKFARTQGSKIGKRFLEDAESAKGIFKQLKLRKKATIEMPEQIFGNCAWASATGAFLALLTLSKKADSPPIKWAEFIESESFKSIQDTHEQWKWKDREDMLNIFLKAQSDPTHQVKFSNEDYFKILSVILFKWGLDQKETDSPKVKQAQERIFDSLMDNLKKGDIPISDCVFKLRGQESEDFLGMMPKGAFCIRKRAGKEKRNTYSLSVSQGENKVVHYDLEKAKDGSFILKGSGKKVETVRTLGDLLNYTELKFPSYPDVKSERIQKRKKWDESLIMPVALEKLGQDKLTEAGVVPTRTQKSQAKKNPAKFGLKEPEVVSEKIDLSKGGVFRIDQLRRAAQKKEI